MYWRRKACHLSLTKPTIPFGKLLQKPNHPYSVPKVIKILTLMKSVLSYLYVIIIGYDYNHGSWLKLVHMQGILMHAIREVACNAYIINLFVYPFLYMIFYLPIIFFIFSLTIASSTGQLVDSDVWGNLQKCMEKFGITPNIAKKVVVLMKKKFGENPTTTEIKCFMS